MAKKEVKRAPVKRKTRIDKDTKTALKHSRVLSFLYDLMWSYRYFPVFATCLLLVDTVVGYVIIQRVPYTEIDWKAYMQQVETFKAGERDYMKIRGDTGPLVYPAGFVYLFSVLHSITNNGEDIRKAQYVFLGFYLVTIATVLAIMYRARAIPPWVTVLLCVSKRLHSIYMLRLFNDGIAMMLLYISIYLFVRQQWRIGCYVFSFAVSIKMNVLLFAPALLFILLRANGLVRTIWYLFNCALIQVLLGWPFLRYNWKHYLMKAFELNRVFTYKWTVNWAFVPQEMFLEKWFALGLLACHLMFLVLFLHKYFNIPATIRSVLAPNAIAIAFQEPNPIRAELIVTSMFATNFVGICFSRTLHYQFYSWFYLTIPYLLWKIDIPLVFRAKVLIAMEFAFNTFPATGASSLAFVLAAAFLVMCLLVNDVDLKKSMQYLDADARMNLVSFVNEEIFDGARQMAMYYGSVAEDLAENASVVAIDEREVLLNLPKMKLTLAIGFGSSGPVTTEGYGKQVLREMINDASYGLALGDTMGKMLNREWLKEKAKNEQDQSQDGATEEPGNLRQRGGKKWSFG